MARGTRKNRLLLVACVVIFAVAVPVSFLSRDSSADAEALVIAQRLDMDLSALPRYGEAMFTNGEVARTVAATYGGQAAQVIPDRVSLDIEPDSVVLRVVGSDPDPETAAAIADLAATAFVQELNRAGVGVGAFALLAEADPDMPAQRVGEEADADSAELTSIAASLAVGVAVGLAVGFALGRLTPARRDDRELGADQAPLF